MMRIAWREISAAGEMLDLGPDFIAHMAKKRNPAVYEASLAAWRLLAEETLKLTDRLPTVRFRNNGKPYFADSGLHFSLSHSGSICAVVISDRPCGVDVERVRVVDERLVRRCMHPEEIASGMDFFDAWTRKECIAKIRGDGMPSRPCELNSLLQTEWRREDILDGAGEKYILTALVTL